jgi:dienelactone hydrolase
VLPSLKKRFVVAALMLAASGCVAHLHRAPSTPAEYVYRPPESADSMFDNSGPITVELSDPIDVTRFHEVVDLSFPSSGVNGDPDSRVEAIYYKSLSPGAKKLVIVMPIWGTSTYPPSRITRGYARRSRGDANIVWVLGKSPLFPWSGLSSTSSEEQFVQMAEDSAERYRTAVVDMRHLLDWAENQSDIDESRIAMVGFSMSALVTATLMGNDSRVSTAVMMMGAANLADVFAMCSNRAGEVRAHVLSAYGWSPEQYRAFFERLFGPADPARYAGRYDPGSILMVDAAFDDCMPRSSRDALWEATGHPERVTLLARHRSGFYSLTPLGFNFVRRKIYAFLDEHL